MKLRRILAILIPTLLLAAFAPILFNSNAAVGDPPVTYGMYPQAQVTNTTTISQLNALGQGDDVALAGNRYAYKDSKWYLYEPIQWRVLSNNGSTMLLLADKVLDAQQYHSTNPSGGISFTNSNLYAWLNGTFTQRAFGATGPTVTLLTEAMASNATYGFTNDQSRVAASTAYAGGTSTWWLTFTTGTGSCYAVPKSATHVDQGALATDTTGSGGSCKYTTIRGVRPVITVNASVVTYTVTYNANGGTGAPAPQTKTGTMSLVLSTVEPTYAGYTFRGWNTTKYGADTGVVQYAKGATYSANASVTLYAVWQANSNMYYFITYNANGGTDAPAQQAKIHNVPVGLTSFAPTRAGYNCIGWNTNQAAANAGTVQYGRGATYSYNANMTLYAVWQAASNYTVTYDANGGSNPPAAQTKLYNEDLKITTAKPGPSPIGLGSSYTFSGWSTTRYSPTDPDSDKIVQYQGGDWYTANANVTLYAVWSFPLPTTYNVTFNANGGTLDGAAGHLLTKYLDVDTAIRQTATRDGYAFLGWAASSTATSAQYKYGDLYTDNKGATLYAVWGYTISYDANGGSGTIAPQAKLEGVDQRITTARPTCIGNSYTFAGWSTSRLPTPAPGGTVVQYQGGDLYTANASVTLYAVWVEPNRPMCTVTFNPNGGSLNGPYSMQIPQGISMVIRQIPAPRGSDYTFLGWSQGSPSGSIIPYGGTLTVSGNVTLYAMWRYELRLNFNDGTSGRITMPKITNVQITLPSPTRPGHTLLGWATSPTATVAQHAPGSSYNHYNDTVMDLYAVWQANTYTITFDANGGTGAPADQTKTHDVPLALTSDEPTYAGYTFLGWNDNQAAANAGTVQYAKGATYSANVGATLYAVWEALPATYTITFDANGGTGTMADQTKTHDVDLTLAANAFTRTGFSFRGWDEDKNAGVPQYADGATYTANAGATLYAIWKADRYNMNFYGNSTAAPFTLPAWHDQSFPFSSVLLMRPFTRVSCVLTGWKDAATGTVYGLSDVITPNRDADFYAVWVFSRDVEDDDYGTTENVTVSPADAFDEGTELIVTNGYGTLPIPGGGGPAVVYYKIIFKRGGVEQQPNGYVTVRLSVPDSFTGDVSKMEILHIKEDGSGLFDVLQITAHGTDPVTGKRWIEFVTDHFSLYALVYDEQGGGTDGPDGPNPPDWNGTSRVFTYKKGNSFTLALPQGVSVREWTTSNAKTATVDGGRVTLRARGNATITVKLTDGTAWTCKVTVKFNFLQWLLYIFCFGFIWMN